MSAPEREKELAQELRLRPERTPVTRLSRGVLIALSAVSITAIFGLTFFALQQRGRSGAAPELYNTETKTAPDGLAGLPRDYTALPKEVPRLGPPLPGDLGRPILAAKGELPLTAVDPEEQRLGQEREAARTSKLFASTNVAERGAAALAFVPTKAASASSTTTPFATEAALLDPGSLQNMQDRKLVFVNAAADRRTVSPDRVAAPASRYVLQAGAVIPAALVTGIRSDLPGQITAQITENVYDSPSGRFLLIPQGAKLIGVYDSEIAFGQSRVLLVWNRIIFPNGNSIVLERQPGADAAGFSGLEDGVDHHWQRLAGAAAMSAFLGVGTQFGSTGNDSQLIQALRLGAANSFNQTGQQIVGRNLNLQPTLTIRPGYPVRVIVTRDLVLAPYGTPAEVAASGLN